MKGDGNQFELNPRVTVGEKIRHFVPSFRTKEEVLKVIVGVKTADSAGKLFSGEGGEGECIF